MRERLHRLYGTTLASAFPFSTWLEGAEGPADFTFELAASPPVPGDWKHGAPLFRSPRKTTDGESASRLYRLDACDALCFHEVADFYLGPDRITCHLLAPEHEPLVEIRLLGPVLSYWMERRGLLALHASAVAVGQRAIGFLGSHGGGKSGLAAGLMRAGYPLLTDDILPIEERDGTFLGRPGYPQMRMWPDEAAHFLGSWEELPLVHPEISKRRVPVGAGGFGSFHPDSLPLAALYVPERREDGPIEIREVPRSEGLLELVRHSFSPRLVEAAGLQPRRFDLFARLVRQISIRRLVYPSGFHRLPEVVEAVLRDLDRLPC